jgi:acyl-CoA synthetase (AMP-forming)/AMP-acid ligase II
MDIWDPEKGLDLIEREKCTFTVLATPFLQQMLDSPTIKGRNIPNFLFICGGAYIPPELIKRAWKVPGWKVLRVYGSTEAPTVTLGIRPGGPMEKASETDGLIFNYDVRIVDFANRPLPAGQDGEIIIKGAKLFVGYRDPALNGDSFDAEGWFHSGDLGRVSADGYLQITGRKKDIIIRGGENLSVKEIEDVLHLHPAVETAATVAMPDVKMGEKVCAYVKCKEGASLTLDDLKKFLLQHKLAKQKWPERLEVIDAFPMTPSGKIKKNELRKDIANKVNLPPVRI